MLDKVRASRAVVPNMLSIGYAFAFGGSGSAIRVGRPVNDA